MFRKLWLVTLGIAILLAACTPSKDTSSDATAAQNLQPNISGYTVSTAKNLTEALTNAGTGAAALQGNVPVAAAIAKAGNVLQCMQDKGAADARIYVETTPTGAIPETGASVVINTTRVNRNLLECLTTGNQSITTQAVEIVPCTGSGSFTYKTENFTYLYIGVGDNLCGFFGQHFNSVKAQGG